MSHRSLEIYFTMQAQNGNKNGRGGGGGQEQITMAQENREQNTHITTDQENVMQ